MPPPLIRLQTKSPTKCFVSVSDDSTDTETETEACELRGHREENAETLDSFEYLQDANRTGASGGISISDATCSITNLRIQDDSDEISMDEYQCSDETGIEDFEFDFQFIDEAEQNEQLFTKRVHAKFCLRCGTGFVQQKNLVLHVEKDDCMAKTRSIEMLLTCSICAQGFIGHPCLRHHIMRHAQTKPFKCKMCSRSFVTQRALYSHYQYHKDFRPFVCDLCPKSYLSAKHLATHRRQHAGERPFACMLCPKRFNKASSLYHHKREHAFKKPFKCKFCNRSYADKSKRNLHMRTHTRCKSGRYSYLCEICGLTHIKSSVGWINRILIEKRKSIDSVICIDEDDQENLGKKIYEKQRWRRKHDRKESSGSSDSVELVEDPLQFTIDLVDE